MRSASSAVGAMVTGRGYFPVGERGHRWLQESRPAVPSSCTHMCTAQGRQPRNTNPSELRPMSKTNVTWVARVSGTSGDFGVYSDNQADQLFIHRPGDGTSGSRGLCSARLRLVFLLDQPCAAIGFASAHRLSCAVNPHPVQDYSDLASQGDLRPL